MGETQPKRLIEITKVREYEQLVKPITEIGARFYSPLSVLNRIYDEDGIPVETLYLVQQKYQNRLQYSLNVIELTNENVILNTLREVAILKKLGMNKFIMGLYGEWRHRQYVGMLFPPYISIRGHIDHRYDFKTGKTDDGRVQEMDPAERKKKEQAFREQIGMFNRDSVAHVIKRVTKGLKFIHSQGIVHTELCANNVFINICFNVKIGGFVHHKKIGSKSKHFNGDPTVLPPECLVDVGDYTSAQPSIDAWALGLLTLEIITGKRHYLKDEKAKRLAGEYLDGLRKPPTLGELDPTTIRDGVQLYDPDVDDFVNSLLNIKAGARLTMDQVIAHPFVARKRDRKEAHRQFKIQVDAYDARKEERSLFTEMVMSQGSNPALNPDLLKNVIRSLPHVEKGDYQLFKQIPEKDLFTNYIGIEASVAIPYNDSNWSRDVLDVSQIDFDDVVAEVDKKLRHVEEDDPEDEEWPHLLRKRTTEPPKQVFYGQSGHPPVKKDYQRYEICFFLKKQWHANERQIFTAIQFGRWYDRSVIHFTDLIRVVDEVDEVVNDYCIRQSRVVIRTELPDAVYFASPLREIRLDAFFQKSPSSRYLQHIYVDVGVKPEANRKKLAKLRELMVDDPNTFPEGVTPLQASVCFQELDSQQFESLEAQMLGEINVQNWDFDDLQREADATRPETILYKLLYERRRNYNNQYTSWNDSAFSNQARCEKIWGDFRRDYLFKVCKWAVPYQVSKDNAELLYGNAFKTKEEVDEAIRSNIPDFAHSLNAQLYRTQIKQEEDVFNSYKRHEDVDLRRAAIEQHENDVKDDDYYKLENQLKRGKGATTRQFHDLETPVKPARPKWGKKLFPPRKTDETDD